MSLVCDLEGFSLEKFIFEDLGSISGPMSRIFCCLFVAVCWSLTRLSKSTQKIVLVSENTSLHVIQCFLIIFIVDHNAVSVGISTKTT